MLYVRTSASKSAAVEQLLLSALETDFRLEDHLVTRLVQYKHLHIIQVSGSTLLGSRAPAYAENPTIDKSPRRTRQVYLNSPQIQSKRLPFPRTEPSAFSRFFSRTPYPPPEPSGDPPSPEATPPRSLNLL